MKIQITWSVPDGEFCGNCFFRCMNTCHCFNTQLIEKEIGTNVEQQKCIQCKNSEIKQCENNIMNRFIDCGQSCNTCGCQFIIRVFDDGTYDYLTESCECKSDFSPCDDELSISEAVEALKPIDF